MKLKLFSNREMPQIAEEDYVEVNVLDSSPAHLTGKVGIKIEKLEDFSDTERIMKNVRAGDVRNLENMATPSDYDWSYCSPVALQLLYIVIIGTGPSRH